MIPKSYKARFIEPGIISYADQSGGTVLVSKDALDQMAPSFKGCPVICVPELHNEAAPDNAFNFEDTERPIACGVITDIWWGDDGWYWCSFLVWDQETADLIKKGYSVSCAYLPDQTKSQGGTWHELPYDEEITRGHYLHLAIVPNPRYEGSKIFANAKGEKKIMNIFKIILPGKKENAASDSKDTAKKSEEKEEVMNADQAVVDVNGTEVPLYELIEAFQMKTEDATKPKKLGPEDSVTLPDGQQIKVSDLIAAYSGKAEKAQEETAESETMENAEEAQDEKAEKVVEKQNATKPKTVNPALKNAARKGDDGGVDKPATKDERLKAGKAKYGSLVQQEGGSK